MNAQMTDLAAWLDELEEARKAATPEALREAVIGALTSVNPYGRFPTWGELADAVLTLPAVRAAPDAQGELVAVLREVLALAEEMEQAGGLPDTHGEFDRGVAAHQRDAAARIRAVVAAAHTEDGR